MTATALFRPLVPLFLGVVLAGCRPPAPARFRPGHDALARRDIERTVARYVRASNAGDAEGLAALYADDAILLPPEDTLVRGRRAIEAFWEKGMETGLSLETVRLDVHGDAAFLVGRYELAETADAPADGGKCAMSLVRQQDGSWQVTTDIWNGDTGSSGAEDDGNEQPITPVT